MSEVRRRGRAAPDQVMIPGCCEHCVQVADLSETASVTRAIVERIETSMVTRGEFSPVRMVAYGLVALMATAFVAAIAGMLWRVS